MCVIWPRLCAVLLSYTRVCISSLLSPLALPHISNILAIITLSYSLFCLHLSRLRKIAVIGGTEKRFINTGTKTSVCRRSVSGLTMLIFEQSNGCHAQAAKKGTFRCTCSRHFNCRIICASVFVKRVRWNTADIIMSNPQSQLVNDKLQVEITLLTTKLNTHTHGM